MLRVNHIDCSGADVRVTARGEYLRPYRPAANPLLLKLAAAHKALFIRWRALDGRVGKQGAADKLAAQMSVVYARMGAL